MGREPVDAGKIGGAGLLVGGGLLAVLGRSADDCGRLAAVTGGHADDFARVGDDLARGAEGLAPHVDDLALPAAAAGHELDVVGDVAGTALDAASIVLSFGEGEEEAVLVVAPADQLDAALARCTSPCLVVAEGFDAAPYWRQTPDDTDAATFVERVGRSLPAGAPARW